MSAGEVRMNKKDYIVIALLLILVLGVFGAIDSFIDSYNLATSELGNIFSKAYTLLAKLDQLEPLIDKAVRYESLLAGVEARCDEIDCVDQIMDLLENRTVVIAE